MFRATVSGRPTRIKPLDVRTGRHFNRNEDAKSPRKGRGMTKNKRAVGDPVWTVPALGAENTPGDQARRNEIENGNLPLVPIQTTSKAGRR